MHLISKGASSHQCSDALSKGDGHLGIDQLPCDHVKPTDEQRQETHDGTAQDLIISLLNFGTDLKL